MNLENLRHQIDRKNEKIADAVAERMRVVEKIGDYKRRNGIEMKDEDREKVVKNQFAELFEQRDLPPESGREFAEKLIDMALERERQ